MALTRVKSAASVETSSNTAHSFPYELTAGSDRMLAAFVLGEVVGSVTEPAISAITFGGTAGRFVDDAFQLEGTDSVKIFGYVWLESDLPEPGSPTPEISVTLSSGFAPGGGETGFAVIVIEYAGAKQAVPANSAPAGTTINASTISVSLTTAADNSHIPAAAVNNNNAREWTGHSGTLLHDLNSRNSRAGAGDEARATAGLGTVSFSTVGDSFGRAAILAFEIEEAVTGTETSSLDAALQKQREATASLQGVARAGKTVGASLDGVVGVQGVSPGRGLVTANDSAAQARVVRPVIFFQLEINDGSPTEIVRASDAPFTISWGGNDWLGVGTFGSVSAVEETTELKAPGVECTLNGIDPSLVAIALGRHIQGDPVTVYLGFLDEGHVLVADPLVLFRGRADTMPIRIGQTASIKLRVESVLADWDRPRVRRYNNADQQQRFPGDKFFEFAEQTVDKDIIWPARSFFENR